MTDIELNKVVVTVDNNGQYYKQQQGVVIGKDFLSKEQFRTVLQDIKQDSSRMERLREARMKLHYWNSIVQKDGKVTNNLDRIMGNLDEAATILADDVFTGLGGKIALLTGFKDEETNKQEIYYFGNEKDLTSDINGNGQRIYRNNLQEVRKLTKQVQDLQLLNKSLTNHFLGFQAQLQNSITDSSFKQIRSHIYVWAYYHMPERYLTEKKNKRRISSLSSYIWGRTKAKIGYYQEAFATHINMFHKEMLDNLMHQSVIDEYGGYDSWNLLNLLLSTKGNISSQLGGDSVVLDEKGQIIWNVQSKASGRNSYNFQISYQQFLKNMLKLSDILESDNDISDSELDKLFNAFKAEAWVPINEELKEMINQNIEKLITKGLSKK